MNQITIRRLDPGVIEGLKKRATEAGRSMEEEARKILNEAVLDEQLARQRAWVKKMQATHRRLYGDTISPDSTPLFREMRDDRTRQIEEWALPTHRQRKIEK